MKVSAVATASIMILTGGCTTLDHITDQQSQVNVVGPPGMLSGGQSLSLHLDGPRHYVPETREVNPLVRWETSYFNDEKNAATVKRCSPESGSQNNPERSCKSHGFNVATPGSNPDQSSVVVFTASGTVDSNVAGHLSGNSVPLPRYYRSHAWEHLQDSISLQGAVPIALLDQAFLSEGEVILNGSATAAPELESSSETILVEYSAANIEVMPISVSLAWVTIRSQRTEDGIVNYIDPLRALMDYGVE